MWINGVWCVLCLGAVLLAVRRMGFGVMSDVDLIRATIGEPLLFESVVGDKGWCEYWDDQQDVILCSDGVMQLDYMGGSYCPSEVFC